MKLNKHYFGRRIQGDRSYQEDDFGFDSSHRDDFLMVLADGMGGYEGGALASERAIQAFMDSYYVASGDTAQRLQHALEKANKQLALEKQSNVALKNMGCTLVGVAISATSIAWISTGDSPLWLLREGRLYRLNADHSMKPELQKQVDAGELTVEQMKTHPDRNMLRSALTGSDIELIDQAQRVLKPNDKILLASDGILSLTTDEINYILTESYQAKQAVNELLEAVENKAKPGQDNTTTLVVYMPNKQYFAVIGEHNWRLFVLLAILVAHLLFWITVQIHWVKPVEIMEDLFPHSETTLSHRSVLDKKPEDIEKKPDDDKQSALPDEELDNRKKPELSEDAPSDEKLDDKLESFEEVQDEQTEDAPAGNAIDKKSDFEQISTNKHKDSTIEKSTPKEEPLVPDSLY